MSRRLQIVGAGKAGSSLARLWFEAGVFTIGTVVNRTLPSSQAAVEFMGAGTAADTLRALESIDVLLVATSDRAIDACALEMARKSSCLPGAIAFHLSGSISSEALAPLRALGCSIASLHPIKSFADPALAVGSFAGTFCAVEGDAEAVTCLREAVECIGGRYLAIDSSQKTIYHAGSVCASNYLTTLLEAGVRCLQAAGVERSQAVEALCQIAQGTVSNVAQLGPVQALTGPIARGEVEVVARQLEALRLALPEVADSYRAAGLLAVELAQVQGRAQPENLRQIEELLRPARR